MASHLFAGITFLLASHLLAGITFLLASHLLAGVTPFGWHHTFLLASPGDVFQVGGAAATAGSAPQAVPMVSGTPRYLLLRSVYNEELRAPKVLQNCSLIFQVSVCVCVCVLSAAALCVQRGAVRTQSAAELLPHFSGECVYVSVCAICCCALCTTRSCAHPKCCRTAPSFFR